MMFIIILKIDLNILPQLNKTITKDLYMCTSFTIRKTYLYAYIHYSFLRKEPKRKKKSCVGRELNPDRLLGRQPC